MRRESDNRCLFTGSDDSGIIYVRLSGVSQCPKEAFSDVVHHWMAVYVTYLFVFS